MSPEAEGLLKPKRKRRSEKSLARGAKRRVPEALPHASISSLAAYGTGLGAPPASALGRFLHGTAGPVVSKALATT